MSSFVNLTPYRAGILRLTEAEGVISASDVARGLGRRGGERAAIKQLRALHILGLLTPVNICEYKLTATGKTWLDNQRSRAGD